MSLNDVFLKYQQGINEAQYLIDFSHSRYQSGGYKHPDVIRRFISKSAFIDIFISWESFLETSFLEYLNGELSASGRAVTRYATPMNLEHGRRIVVGTNKFFDWGNPEIVRRIASLYFEDGEPFSTTIGAVNSDLLDMRNVRNAAAHITSTTQTQLDATASRWLLRPVSNIEVYDFIFSSLPNVNPTKTVLSKLIESLNAAAFNITNY